MNPLLYIEDQELFLLLSLFIAWLLIRLEGLVNFRERLDFVDDKEALFNASNELKGKGANNVLLASFTSDQGYDQNTLADIVFYLGSHDIKAHLKTSITGMGDGAITRFELSVANVQLLRANQLLKRKLDPGKG